MTHTGSCHCGGIKYEADVDLKTALECNCSLCYKRGAPLTFMPKANLKLLTPDANASTYTFKKHAIRHRFCANCGVHVFGEATDPKSGEAMVALNLRTIDGLDLESLQVHHYDGRSV